MLLHVQLHLLLSRGILQNDLETLSTLRFGTRAKQIQNRPTAHVERSVAEYKLVRRLLVDGVATQLC